MIKRYLFIFLALFSIAFSQMASECFAATPDTLDQAKQNIISLIDAHDFAGAESAISKMSSDFSGQQSLPETLYSLAVKYEWPDRYEEAKRVYQQVIISYPDNIWAKKPSWVMQELMRCRLCGCRIMIVPNRFSINW